MLTLLLVACSGEPEDSAAPAGCPDGERLDGLACVPEACGVGPFGDREGEHYVDPLNLGERDGSREHPWEDIHEAFSHAEPGDTVVLASGVHKGLVRFDLAPRGVRLLGRCTALTWLDGQGSTVTVFGEDTDTWLEQLTVTGGVEAGVFSFAEDVVLRDVDLVEPGYVGFWVAEGGVATLERVRVSDPLLDPFYESAWGIVVTEDSDLVARELSIERAVDAGVFLEQAGRVELEGLVVRETAAKSDGSGAAIVALGGDLLTVRDCVLTDNHLAGVFLEPGAEALVEGCWIEGVDAPVASSYAAGVVAVQARLTVRDTLIRDVEGTGAEVAGPDGHVVLEDVEIEHTHVSTEAYANGFGLTVRQGLLEARRTTLVDTMAVGVWVSDAGRVELEDVVVEGVVEGPSFAAAAGVYARESGQAVLDGVEVRGIAGNGLAITSGGGVEGEGLLVEAIDAAVPGTGHCVDVAAGTLTLRDVTLRDCREVALVVGEGGAGLVEGALIEDIGTSDSYGLGLGLLAQSEGTLRAVDAVIRRTASSAAAATTGGELSLEDVLIEEARLNDAYDNGYALYVPEGGRLDATGLVVRSAGGVGGLVSGAGSWMRLADSVLEGVYRSTGAPTAFGLLVQDQGALELDGVRLVDLEGPGVACSSGASLSAGRVDIVGARFAGVVLQGCDAALDGVAVSSVAEDPFTGGGLGVFIDGEGHGPNRVLAAALSSRDCPVGGLLAVGPGELDLDVDLQGSEGVLLGQRRVMGHALAAVGCGTLSVGGALAGGRTGLFLHDCLPSLGTLDFQDNGVDLHQQACGEQTVEPPPGATSTTCPSYDELMIPLDFDAVLEEASLEP